MNKINEFIRNISPFNSRTEMPAVLYIVKVILIFYAFKFGAELVGEALAMAIHFACGKNPLQGEMFDSNTITLITYLGYSVMIAVILLFWKLFQKKNPSEIGFTKSAGSYFTGIALGTVILAACVLPVMLAGTLKLNGVFSNIDIKMVLLMIPCFIFQGAMEEVLCRGIVQQLLIKKTPAYVAFAVTAALFTIPHLDNMAQASPAIAIVAVVNLVLISLVFSLLTFRFKNIWAACGLHSVWNYILFVVMGLNLSGNDETVTAVFDVRTAGSSILNGAEYGIEASIITTAVLALAAGILFLTLPKSTKKTAGITSEAGCLPLNG
ncbi:MAG: CPBP family intramembrane metalloprotease [Saccharofermentans sp.]|nr:CPBP family intramembrane metalloprotease [Saccharofermentans sp.]